MAEMSETASSAPWSSNVPTMALPTTTASACAETSFAISGVEMPNPAATGSRHDCFAGSSSAASSGGSELRTPVTVILSQCDYLLEDRELSEEERSAVEAIRRKARSMSKMISQLLFLSRADQGRQAVHKELLDLSLITEMAAEEQEAMAAEKNISIVRDIEEGIEGYVDETLFIRLWMNLIGNAISYGKEGGWLKVSLKKEKNTVFGAVEDNGIGISQEQLPHIWERFYQADTSRTGKENAGSGLGLPMVKWIVETHGGKISVRSTPGAGSRFAFYLPLDPTADPAAVTFGEKEV